MTTRRGVLGLLAGGAVAGPSMAKEALRGAAGYIGSGSNFQTAGLVDYAEKGTDAIGGYFEMSAKERAQQQLTALLNPTARDLFNRRQRRMDSTSFDDIEGMRSVAPWFKRQMMSERMHARELYRQRSWLQATIDGIFGDD